MNFYISLLLLLQVMWKSFEPRILSRLGKLYRAKTHEEIIKYVDMYSLEDNEFYVDRDPGDLISFEQPQWRI